MNVFLFAEKATPHKPVGGNECRRKVNLPQARSKIASRMKIAIALRCHSVCLRNFRCDGDADTAALVNTMLSPHIRRGYSLPRHHFCRELYFFVFAFSGSVTALFGLAP